MKFRHSVEEKTYVLHLRFSTRKNANHVCRSGLLRCIPDKPEQVLDTVPAGIR